MDNKGCYCRKCGHQGQLLERKKKKPHVNPKPGIFNKHHAKHSIFKTKVYPLQQRNKPLQNPKRNNVLPPLQKKKHGMKCSTCNCLFKDGEKYYKIESGTVKIEKNFMVKDVKTKMFCKEHFNEVI